LTALPSGYPPVNGGMDFGRRCSRPANTGWLHQLTATPAPIGLVGHGTCGQQAMIATLGTGSSASPLEGSVVAAREEAT
jgi:hypothetical protein